MCAPIRMALVFTFALAGASFAQTAQKTNPPAFTSVPPIEIVDLYYSFFNYHQGLVNTMNSAQTANAASAAAGSATSSQLNQQMATTLGVSIQDLPTVIANTQQVTQAYAALTAANQAGTFALPKGAPALTPAQQASSYAFQKVRLTEGAGPPP